MRRMAALALTMTALAGAPALAQIAGSGGPIDITANELELVDAQRLAIWRGDVEALQGKGRLRADQISLYFSGRGGGPSSGAPGRSWGAVQRVEATGKVYYVTPDQTARGDRAVYEAGANTVTLTGDVIVGQGQSVVRGDKLVINMVTGKATMVSDARGRGASGRVRGVFYPNGKLLGAPEAPPPRN